MNVSSRTGASRLTRRGRLARFLVVFSLAIVLGAAFSMKAGAGSVVTQSDTQTFITVVVAPGQTLWSIASDESHGRDIRGLIGAIMEANSLTLPDVSAGDLLRIPA